MYLYFICIYIHTYICGYIYQIADVKHFSIQFECSVISHIVKEKCFG